MTTRAVVFGGGGLFGIGWETGVAVGLAEAGIDLCKADLFVGTSAGANVAAQINAGLTPGELLQRQTDPARREKEIPYPRGLQEIMVETSRLKAGARDYKHALQLIGHYALATPTVTEEERRAVITARLNLHNLNDWPSANIAITAVEASSGERVVFNRNAGVSLADAVTASSALPGIWPPVTIGNSRYIDGGVYSMENADLAAGYDRVIILQPITSLFPETALQVQLEQLEKKGSRTRVIVPAGPVMAALSEKDANPLDSSIREVAALLGREQGQKEASSLADFWN
ncbi:MAG TPA: patatin-like phospholipase family protein [Chloroflexia bacterium]|nr:patatin-like phospholipase family protein [Chloroflexia bacterium]